MTQVTLVESLKSSQLRVAKMEAGDSTVALDLLIKSLLALGASNRDLAAIIG
jgi:chemotaxis receptor (MCP) glutamine deamidase CheD